MKKLYPIFLVIILAGCGNQEQTVQPVTEQTPSKSNYFDWINNEWPGTHQQKVLANLDFFEWLHDDYGMQLDIYHIDAGNIDRSPYWITEAKTYEEALEMCYGHIDDERVRKKFPEAFNPIVEKADKMNTRMGIWLGPDGYGTTPEEAEKRRSMLVNFCRDYNFGLFKFDNACTDLSEENVDEFIKTMHECRQHTPDLIALNHRITLTDSAEKHMTTWLWEGKETYIDVHLWNETTAPHHRAGALSRGLPPELSRLTEDHGVCISSCLNYWEDDLILQAFNRNLILAPQIYGSPWLLSDDEFPKLARIYNLHKKYNDILIDGIILPEDDYGPHTVSRGDADTRLLTLRNLSWNSKTYHITLDDEIGISEGDQFLVKQLHPTEHSIGIFSPGEEVSIKVQPFRASLVLVTSGFNKELNIDGINYEVVKMIEDEPLEINLLAYPGEEKEIRLNPGKFSFSSATIDEKPANELLDKNLVSVKFDGNRLSNDYHRKIAIFEKTGIPEDASSLYEATCFAADNNALEVRSVKRSGPTNISEVQQARNMFFNDSIFWKKGIWDKYAIDNDPTTAFKVRSYRLASRAVSPGAFRMNFGELIEFDSIVMTGVIDTFRFPSAHVSSDLLEWKKLSITRTDKNLKIIINQKQPVQFIKINKSPISITELKVYNNGTSLEPQKKWQLSNLFPASDEMNVKHHWSTSFKLDEVAENSYLCIAIPGEYGNEGAYAAIKVNNEYRGAPDRSPSFESNHWEHGVFKAKGHYTYYFPLTKADAGTTIEAFVLGFTDESKHTSPEVWITAYPVPFQKKKLVLYP